MTCRSLLAISLLWAVGIALFPMAASSAIGGWATAVLIAANFVASIWTLLKKKRIPILLILAQIGLFGLLHFQLFSISGPKHYQFDHWPRFADWLTFTAAHVVRAIDVLDFLESYGIELQHVKHRSPLAAALLVWMHLAVGIFLVSLVACWAWNFWKRLREENQGRAITQPSPWSRKLLAIQRCVLFCCLLALLATAVVQNWAARDWFLWPLDNAIRTIDVGRTMHIFGWKLHNLEAGAWLATLGLLFRVVVGSYLARWIRYAHMSLLGPSALKTIDEFIRDLEDEDAFVREGAIVALGNLGREAQPAVPPLASLLADENWRVVDAVRWALQRIGAPAPGAVPSLMQLLNSDSWPVRRKAVELLGAVGPSAGSAVSQLIELLADQDKETQAQAERALQKISPSWNLGIGAIEATPALIDKLGASDNAIRQTAADVLGRLGESARPAMPALLRRLQDRHEYVRLCAAMALDHIEPSWRDEVFELQAAEN